MSDYWERHPFWGPFFLVLGLLLIACLLFWAMWWFVTWAYTLDSLGIVLLIVVMAVGLATFVGAGVWWVERK